VDGSVSLFAGASWTDYKSVGWLGSQMGGRVGWLST